MTEARRLVDKLWSYCNVLRDDGVSTIDDVEQLVYLLFLKMAHKRATRQVKSERIVPAECSWQRLLDADGDQLEVIYRQILARLGRERGVLGVVFRQAQNKVQDPAKRKRLVVDLIGKDNWSATGVDIKGDAYEELLAKGAEDVKSGAGQYFTPRALIQAMVDCVRPTASDTRRRQPHRRARCVAARRRPAPERRAGEPALWPQELDHHGRGRRARGARGHQGRSPSTSG